MIHRHTLMVFELIVHIIYAKYVWIQIKKKSLYLIAFDCILHHHITSMRIEIFKCLYFFHDYSYTLVVSQYEKTTTIYYTLRAFSRNPFEFKAIPSTFVGKQTINGEWKGIRAGGCQNHPATYRNNPKYKLKIGPKDQNNLVIELRGPKVYQVGFEIIVIALDDPNITAPFVSKVTGNYRSGYCVLDLNDIPAGTYHLIPSTYLPAQESPFILSVKATTTISIELIN